MVPSHHLETTAELNELFREVKVLPEAPPAQMKHDPVTAAKCVASVDNFKASVRSVFQGGCDDQCWGSSTTLGVSQEDHQPPALGRRTCRRVSGSAAVMSGPQRHERGWERVMCVQVCSVCDMYTWICAMGTAHRHSIGTCVVSVCMSHACIRHMHVAHA